MSPVKEPGFFWAHGQEKYLYGPGINALKHRIYNDLVSYQGLFEGAKSEKAVGESSVRYLAHPRSPELIHRFIPQAILIINLRHPADRAFSEFLHNLRDGLEPCDNFADAIIEDRQGLRDQWTIGRYLHPGFYYAAIKRHLEYFDRQQLTISLIEDLFEDPLSILQSIFRKLGVDDIFVPDLSHRHNVSGVIGNPLSRFVWTRSNWLRAAIRPLLSERVRHSVSEWVFRDVKKPLFEPELRAELTDIYCQDIKKLQDFLQRDLSHWLGISADSQTGQPEPDI